MSHAQSDIAALSEVFKKDLLVKGFNEGLVRDMAPNLFVDDHAHPFEVRAMVTQGLATLTIEGVQTTYQPGEIFTMAPDCIHKELFGPTGAQYIVGRRYP
jgi:quercetin dioxygenase-like cupin family protein